MNDATRRTVRTVIAVILAIAVTLPVFLDQLGIDPQQIPWLATTVAVLAVITRAMQSPIIDEILTKLGVGKSPADNGKHEQP